MAVLNLSAVEGTSVSRIPSSASFSGGFTLGTSSGCFRKDGTVLTELAAMDGTPRLPTFRSTFLVAEIRLQRHNAQTPPASALEHARSVGRPERLLQPTSPFEVTALDCEMTNEKNLLQFCDVKRTEPGAATLR